MTAMNYRVRVFDRAYELFHKRRILVVFDEQAAGPTAHAQESKIDAMLTALREIARRDEGSDPEDVRLELCALEDDEDRAVFTWDGR